MASLATSAPKSASQPLHPQPIAKRLEEMDDTKWGEYQKNAAKWYGVYASKPKAVLEQA